MGLKMGNKTSLLEFLMTYAWIILIGILGIGVIIYSQLRADSDVPISTMEQFCNNHSMSYAMDVSILYFCYNDTALKQFVPINKTWRFID